MCYSEAVCFSICVSVHMSMFVCVCVCACVLAMEATLPPKLPPKLPMRCYWCYLGNCGRKVSLASQREWCAFYSDPHDMVVWFSRL